MNHRPARAAHHASRPAASLLGSLWLLQACVSWHPQAARPLDVARANQGKELRLHLVGGAVRSLRGIRLTNDTIRGIDMNHYFEVAVPADSVASIETSGINVVGTVLLVGAGALLVSSAINGQKDPPPPPPPTTSCAGCGPSSCPTVYSWDGARWRRDSGTFGGAIAQAFQRTDVDNLVYARAESGTLRLRLTNELPETDHIDALAVIAVDHDAALTVAPDAAGRLHSLGELRAPLTAADDRGRDVRGRVAAVDGYGWESALVARDTSRDDQVRDGITLTFARPAGARRAHLVVDGNATPWAAELMRRFIEAHGTATAAWYDSLNANPSFAAATGMQMAREGFLTVSVWNASRFAPAGLIWDAGPEVSKQQVLELDLAAVPGDTIRVRLESVPAFWHLDRVAMDFTEDRPLREQPLTPRGVRDARGRDLAPALAAIDHSYVDMETGDAAVLEYDVPDAPAAGQARSFILRTTGWYQIHTDTARAPDVALLRAVSAGRLGMSRAAVAQLNARLDQLAQGDW